MSAASFQSSQKSKAVPSPFVGIIEIVFQPARWNLLLV